MKYEALEEKLQQQNLSKCQSFIHKSHMNLPGIEPVCNAPNDKLINE